MIELTHLIYCSTANQDFNDEALEALLDNARSHNMTIDVTGMLLYENGSFFQVIEGPSETIKTLFQEISADTRHRNVITIIHEPIVKRAFSEWTMGYSRVSSKEVGEIVGLNDFFTEGNSLNQLDSSRAKKLLNVFKQGRWRARIQPVSLQSNIQIDNDPTRALKPKESSPQIKSAFQPIIDSQNLETIAYEAMPCDLNGQLLDTNAIRNYQSKCHNFDSDYWVSAISLARKLNINCNLIFTLSATQVSNAHTAISSMLDAANKAAISPNRIILKVNQDNLIGDVELFARMIQEFRAAGLKLAIDTFGAGRSSMNLLETYQPDYISLNAQLVNGIESNGARQAIVRGIHQSCQDLGIEVIANHIHSFAEFEWFNHEGISLFQGDLIAKPEFETLSTGFIPELDEG